MAMSPIKLTLEELAKSILEKRNDPDVAGEHMKRLNIVHTLLKGYENMYGNNPGITEKLNFCRTKVEQAMVLIKRDAVAAAKCLKEAAGMLP
jgi:hypothetical protein